jgi:hypothetical protein
VAKDGADLPPTENAVKPALRRLNVGEMFDAEFTAGEAGEYRLTIGYSPTAMIYNRRIVVH